MDSLDLLYEVLGQIQNGIFSGTLDNVCTSLYEQHLDSSTRLKEMFDRIRRIDWQQFNEECVNLIIERYDTLEKTKEHRPVKAIYYEYDLDNGWSGAFFFCNDYNPIRNVDDDGFIDDDWACDYCDDFDAPELPYLPSSGIFYDEEGSNDALHYAIAELTRNFVAVNDYLHKVRPEIPNLFIAFHDQTPITRLSIEN